MSAIETWLDECDLVETDDKQITGGERPALQLLTRAESHVKSAEPSPDRGTIVTVVANSGAWDRDGERLKPKGWVIPPILPKALYGHNWGGLPVGKITSARKSEEEGLVERIEMADKVEGHEFALVTTNLIRGGFLDQVSVGFRPLKWTDPDGSEHSIEKGDYAGWPLSGREYEKQELLETSFVPVPSDVSAAVLGVKGGASSGTILAFMLRGLGKGTGATEGAKRPAEPRSPAPVPCPICAAKACSDQQLVRRSVLASVVVLLSVEKTEAGASAYAHLTDHAKDLGIGSLPRYQKRSDPFDLEWIFQYGAPFIGDKQTAA